VLAIVIPCYNEASRLQKNFFEELSNTFDCKILVVDDGSTDCTNEILQKFAEDIPIRILTLPANFGKALAMKNGLDLAISLKLDFVIFCDADGSLKISDIEILFSTISKNPQVDCVSGARVPMSGWMVKRKTYRKWIGRIVATIIGITTGFEIYDPMSPAKIYRTKSLLNIEDYVPKTKWLGEVELLLFLEEMHSKKIEVLEIPLSTWFDADGGHIRLRSIFILLKDFAYIFFRSGQVRKARVGNF
jgi:dolichyl-phosphate beta-glucosyltransferase